MFIFKQLGDLLIILRESSPIAYCIGFTYSYDIAVCVGFYSGSILQHVKWRHGRLIRRPRRD